VTIKVSRRHAVLPCDFCRNAVAREERHRLVWDSGAAGELILAELCAGCATKFSGSRTSQLETVRLVQDARASVPASKVAGVARVAARGLLYLLIAVACFLIVTLVSSSAH